MKVTLSKLDDDDENDIDNVDDNNDEYNHSRRIVSW